MLGHISIPNFYLQIWSEASKAQKTFPEVGFTSSIGSSPVIKSPLKPGLVNTPILFPFNSFQNWEHHISLRLRFPWSTKIVTNDNIIDNDIITVTTISVGSDDVRSSAIKTV